MTKGGKLNDGIFEGETINTPSMLCVEDYLDALNWGKSIGGLKALMARADANTKVLADWKAKTPWIDFLAKDPAIRSNTSVCLKVVDPAITSLSADAQADFAKKLVALVEKEDAGFDFAHYRDAPAGLRIWCGATVEAKDVELLTQWIDWAFAETKAQLAEGGVDSLFDRRPGQAALRCATRDPSTTRAREYGSRLFAPSGASAETTLSICQRIIPMSKPKVLISDALSPAAVQIFKDRGVEVDFQPNLGKDKDKLAEIIGDYDGLAIRSATKATAKIIEKAKRLKVIGRAGIGVDNVEIPAATAKGIIVMNTPFGNSITTAEHAITLMLALAREIPQADASTQAGKWEKNRFMGVEITGKTLGVIGCGNIGSIVADRALGLRMKVIAFDPFLSPERAKDIGVEKVELDDLLKRADFITLHTPLTEKTRNIIDAAALAKMKKGVRIINCARGGLVDEQALVDALNSKHVAGAAFDVFVEEPATKNVLFGHPNVICTPHLGASTTEAQENVALQVAEQMSDYLLNGAISNAVNFPSITAEEAPKLRPFIELAEKLGSFAGPAHRDRHREGADHL